MIKRGHVFVGILGGVAITLALDVAWRRLWGSWDMPGSYFGGDLVAYLNGARRLIETGSPYHAALHAGPIENRIENVPIGYLYPPPIAQLLAPLVDIPLRTLAIANALAQAIIFAILLPRTYVQGGGTLSLVSVSALWCTAILFFPLSMALYGGNVSGWIAIGVGLMLLRPRTAGSIAAAATLVKMTPVVLVLPALISGVGRTRMIVGGTAALGLSLAIAPTAWIDWILVLPNILRFPMSHDSINMSTGAVFGSAGAPPFGAVAGYGLAIGAIAASVLLARRRRHQAAIAAAVMALVFAPPSLFDHYLVPTFVVACAVWPRARAVTRVILIAFAGAGLAMWTPSLVPMVRPVLLVVIVATSVALVVEMLGRSPHGDAPAAGSL